jgi:hypothetical protein
LLGQLVLYGFPDWGKNHPNVLNFMRTFMDRYNVLALASASCCGTRSLRSSV